MSQHYSVIFENNTVKLSKIEPIKTVLHRKFEGELKTATVLRTCKGCYYISILVEDGNELQLKDREWTCPDCKTKHDRDINAAINIKKFVLIEQNLLS
ncbi:MULTISPECIES: zinc ribbon domain-containing protein [unclassified Methanosarcina]|uniref:zinc ribbon domain-containing protein n=1 Tax=unclassified Methanosarcina TaxID=2644672 RepID=UPI0006154EE4|nr:Mobile element protein [Methanosarcina sp. WWM596]AKB20879.1 Mobile element protein [Methanosarcina sp. WH1]